MRFSLIDLLIAIAIGLLSVFLVRCVTVWMGSGRALELPLVLAVAILLYLLITPPIYRHFGFFPLFLPVCPHCKRRPESYRISVTDSPRLQMICNACERSFDLWLEQPGTERVSKNVPSLLWSWPQSIGRYRVISSGEPE
jgi:hypothetical protein